MRGVDEGSRDTSSVMGTEPLDTPEPSGELDGAAGVSLVAYVGAELHEAPLREGPPLVVGRSLPATLILSDSKLSREHARFTLRDGYVELVDLASRNGSWLRGARVEQARLSIGDELLLGTTLLRVRGPEPLALDPSTDAYLAGPLMTPLLADAGRVAASNIPVVLHGETGTGKEVFAQLLHDAGPRRGKPFVRVNCAAIPPLLVEGTLFGHERGAYTGAHQRQRGLFEAADGGTIFLDEIGELPHAAQASMLRVLESGTFSRVGSPTELRVDVRIVTATHRSLTEMVASGAFRADLYYRLSGVTLELPPLRARRSDIEPIVRRLLARAAHANQRAVRGVSPGVVRALERLEWPGNVRELKNALDHAVVLCRTSVIELSDLPAPLRAQAHEGPAASTPRGHRAQPSAQHHTALPEPALPDAGLPPSEPPAPGVDLRPKIDEYEGQLIVDALRKTRGNKTEAAKLLGLPIRTLSRRIKRLGIGPAGDST